MTPDQQSPATPGPIMRVVTLNCSSCGAALEIDPGMSQFACAYCGAALAVERRGGTIALRQVVDAVAQVQVGTDKTAAELAIARLTRELDAAKAAWAACDADLSRTLLPQGVQIFLGLVAAGALCGAVISGVAIVQSLSGTPSEGGNPAAFFVVTLIVMLVSGGILKANSSSYLTRRSELWRPHGERIAWLHAQIEKHRAIVDR